MRKTSKWRGSDDENDPENKGNLMQEDNLEIKTTSN